MNKKLKINIAIVLIIGIILIILLVIAETSHAADSTPKPGDVVIYTIVSIQGSNIVLAEKAEIANTYISLQNITYPIKTQKMIIPLGQIFYLYSEPSDKKIEKEKPL
jgi:hypothetical protein